MAAKVLKELLHLVHDLGIEMETSGVSETRSVDDGKVCIERAALDRGNLVSGNSICLAWCSSWQKEADPVSRSVANCGGEARTCIQTFTDELQIFT